MQFCHGESLVKNATLRQLKTFVLVARRLSFSRAAEELHLTQPAVSEQIKQLEAHVGTPLFEKLGKRIFLTPAGKEMLLHSQEIIDQFAKAEEAMERIRESSKERLRVGMITAGSYLFPHIISIFMQRHQGIELEVAVQNHDELMQRLDDNLSDVVLMVGASKDPSIVSQPFAPHPFVVVAAPNHPLARARRIPLATLASERFLVREQGSDTWSAMKQNLLDKLEQPPATLEIKSTEAIKQAVIAGLGVSFLSAYTLGAELQAGSLAVLDVEGFPVADHWQVAHRTEKVLTGAALAFKHFLLNEGAMQIEQVSGIDHQAMLAGASSMPPEVAVLKPFRAPR
jgi:LysR family transcriptional regulator, low CO2-responsive transcriptional regulator